MPICAHILSAVYIITFVVYIGLAFYLIAFDIKNSINKVFFITLIMMSIWALTYSFAVNAPNYEYALLMRKIASLSWLAVFALYLHTFVLITRTKKDKLPLFNLITIYATPVAIAYLLWFDKTVSDSFFNLELTEYGWQNFGPISPILMWICAYMVIFAGTAIILIFVWRNKTRIYREKKQASLIGFGILFTFQFGFYSDMIMPLFFNKVSPETGVLSTVMPMFITWYAIVKYKIAPISVENLSKKIVANMNEGLIIINESGLISHVNKNTTNILKMNSSSLKRKNFTSIFNEQPQDLVKYFPIKRNDGESDFVFSENYEKNMYNSNKQVVPVTISFAPMYDKWGDFVGGCAIFSDTSDIKKAQNDLRIAHEELEQKIINRTSELNSSNIKLLSQISNREYKNNWNKLLSRISSSFVTINSNNIEAKMNKMLENTAKFFDVDISQIYILDYSTNSMISNYEWISSNIDSTRYSTHSIPVEKYKWASSLLYKGPIVINDVDELTDDAVNEKVILKKLNIKSSLTLPLISNNVLIGFCRFDSVIKKKTWNNDNIKMISFLTNMIIDSIIKVEGEHRITQLAYHDSLTGLPNRYKIAESIENLIKITPEYLNFAVVLLDFDSFKNVTDSLGYDAGDEFIKIIAKELCSIIGNCDHICRFDGDEFILVLDNMVSLDDLNAKVNNIYNVFQKQYIVKGQKLSITASIGVSIYPDDGQTSSDLIKNADIAMHKSKKTGKNKFLICSDELRNEITRHTILTNDLYNAIENYQLYIVYQPQVELSSRKIIGVEALVRWKHPELGSIPPSEFIPIAEATGLIIPIGEWVLSNAIKQAKEWEYIYSKVVNVAVNLSLSQFIIDNFADYIIQILKNNNFDPQNLELEITESIAMDKNSNILNTLHDFKKHGIKISMDDFGTQYSSLSRIKEMPIDTLKVALEFVQNLENSAKDREIANIIITIAKNLNLKLIAEGAETEFQIKFLEEKLVDIVQGYYFYKPMSANDISKLLESK